MTKFLGAVVFMLGMVSVANAQNTVTPLLGFSQGAVNFGANFEHQLDAGTGIGGYFHYASKDDSPGVGKPQVISFGGYMPIHFTPSNGYFDTYIGPGFGLNMVDYGGAANDETVVGPSIKLGFMYRLNSTMKVGLDHLHIVNWFTDKAPASFAFTNAAMSFEF